MQAYVAPATAENGQLDRAENYATVTMAQLAQESGIQNFSNFFVNNPNSPIQWPFAVGVPISYGFGQRSGEFHEGVDFTPGRGLADPGDRRRRRAHRYHTPAAPTA